jgi:hypothetical protein
LDRPDRLAGDQLCGDWRVVGFVGMRCEVERDPLFSEEVSGRKAQIGQRRNDSVVEQLSTEFGEIEKEVLAQKRQIVSTLINCHFISFRSGYD